MDMRKSRLDVKIRRKKHPRKSRRDESYDTSIHLAVHAQTSPIHQSTKKPQATGSPQPIHPSILHHPSINPSQPATSSLTPSPHQSVHPPTHQSNHTPLPNQPSHPPAHCWLRQGCCSTPLPTQGAPSNCGRGLLHCRCLCW